MFVSEEHLDKLHERDIEVATPLDVAIDFQKWNVLQIFIRFDINDDTIIQAIGNLLSDYDFVGSSILDQFVFRIMLIKKWLSRKECNFLLQRAFDGNAWPFVIPLLHCSDFPQNQFENCFNWYVAEAPHILSKTLSAFLAEERERSIPGNSIWSFLDDKLRVKQFALFYMNEASLLSFIHHHRKKMLAKGMKDAVRKGKYSYKLIKRLMRIYFPN